MLDWVRDNQTLVWILGVTSAVMFVGSLIAIPFIVARIPADYFAHRHRHRDIRTGRHPVVHVLILVFKNLLGVIFVAAGVAMLLLPGQGILTIVIGVLLLDLPGKYQIERWIVRRRSVLRALNWIRARSGAPPLQV